MNYAVLHFEKAPGGSTDGGLDVHIERTETDGRTHVPKNAIIDFAGLRQRELIAGAESRRSAINRRLKEFSDTPGTRKISKNQIQVVRVLLSGSHDQMERLKAEGRLHEWEQASVRWLQQEFGSENIVSAVAHYDEKTPHIHATLIPITSRPERRAAERKKPKANVPRLAVHDILTPQSLRVMQTTYAAAVKDYGFQRGVVGSDAKHVSTREHYSDEVRRLQAEIESKQLDVDKLIEELIKREEENQNLREENLALSEQREQKRKDLDRENGSAIRRGLANIIGRSVDDVTKQRDAEIQRLKAEKKDLQQQLNEVKKQLKENTDLTERQRAELLAQAKKLREEKLALHAEIKRLKAIIEDEPKRIEAAKQEGAATERQRTAATIQAANTERDTYKKMYSESQYALRQAEKEAEEWKLSHYRSKWLESLINACYRLGLNNVAAIADLVYNGIYRAIGFLDWCDLQLAKEVTFYVYTSDVTETRTTKKGGSISYEQVKVGEQAEILVNDPELAEGITAESWLAARKQIQDENVSHGRHL